MKLISINYILLIVLLSSCGRNQDEDAELDLDTEIAISEVEIEKTFTSIDDIADQAELGNTITKKTNETNDVLSGCATITKDTLSGSTVDTININVDFGSTPCEGDDGKFRQGIVKITSFINNSNSTRIERKIETINYIVDGNSIQLVKKLDYLGLDPQNNHKWQQDMTASIDFSDGTSIQRNSDRLRVWVDGDSTPFDWTDDAYTLEGTDTGVRVDGKTITKETTQTIMIHANCPNIVSGVLKITTDGRPDLSIDYGDGTCDNKATAHSQGQSWAITL